MNPTDSEPMQTKFSGISIPQLNTIFGTAGCLLSPSRKRTRSTTSSIQTIMTDVHVSKKRRTSIASPDVSITSLLADEYVIESTELARRLTSDHDIPRPTIILDIRGLSSQSCVHIRGSIGIPCESRIKLRLVIPLLDELLEQFAQEKSQPKEAAGCMDRRQMVVICTDDPMTSTSDLIIRRLIAHIQNEHHLTVRVIHGGFQQFHKSFPHLCERPLVLRQCRPDVRQLHGLTGKAPVRHRLVEPGDVLSVTAHSDAICQCPMALSNSELVVLRGLYLNTSTDNLMLEVTCQPETQSIRRNVLGSRVPKSGESTDIYLTKISQILPFLFIGNEMDSINEELLSSLSISHVLNLTPKTPFPNEKRFHCHRLALSDSQTENLRPLLKSAFEFIEESRLAGQSVLVHCQAGVSRSPTFVIAYLMAHSSMSLHEAYRFVKRKRSIISPNFSFLGQLTELEADLLTGQIERKSKILPPLMMVTGELDSSHTDDLRLAAKAQLPPLLPVQTEVEFFDAPPVR